MTIAYELLEEYTGTRINKMPDMENEGEIITSEDPCTDVKVRFTCGDSGCVHERTVNVCFDADGVYDEAATLVRVQEVANGVAHKITAGVIN